MRITVRRVLEILATYPNHDDLFRANTRIWSQRT